MPQLKKNLNLIPIIFPLRGLTNLNMSNSSVLSYFRSFHPYQTRKDNIELRFW